MQVMDGAVAVVDTQSDIETLYRADADRLWRAIFAFAGDAEIASDAVAEACAQVLYRGEAVRDPAAWIWRAAALGSAERAAPVPVPVPVRSRGFDGRSAVVLLLAAALLVGLLAGAIIVGSGLTPPTPSPTPSASATANPTGVPSPSTATTPAVPIGRFVPAGSLGVPRARPRRSRSRTAASSSSEGRVSHVEHSSNTLESIEIWDPVSGAFTGSGQMRRATYGDDFVGPHAFRMADGRVLLIPAGCVCGPLPSSSPAQVWDPVSGAQPLETFAIRRVAYTATQLADGRILIAGGVPGLVGDELAAVEVWDPVAGTTESTGALSFARADAAATLLTDGRALIIGGAIRSNSATGVIPVGEAEIWDPASGTFSTAFTYESGPGGSPGVGRRSSAVTLQDGRVLVLDDAGARVWDPIATTLSEAGSFRQVRTEFSATLLLDGRVLVAGGGDLSSRPDEGYVALRSTELLDPATGRFDPGPDLAEARAGHTATLLAYGRVLVVGGFRTAGLALDAVAAAELWEPLPAGGQ
jgi:hypothetical protein